MFAALASARPVAGSGTGRSSCEFERGREPAGLEGAEDGCACSSQWNSNESWEDSVQDRSKKSSRDCAAAVCGACSR